MTACVNKKHSRRVAAAVSASLVGALTLGAAPAIVMAEEAPVDSQWVTAEGAFENSKILSIAFNHGGSQVVPTPDADGIYHFGYSRNKPVALDAVRLDLIGSATERPDFTIKADDKGDNYEVAYYNRNEDDKPEGAAITKDIVDAGKYVAVITALDESGYAVGTLAIPFDIDPIDISGIQLQGELKSVYDAEAKDITFWLDTNGTPGIQSDDYELYLGTDITVQWYVTGHDMGKEYEAESVKDAGDYRAHIEGVAGGNYSGSADLNTGVVTVDQLDLSVATNWIPDVYSDSASEPKTVNVIFIAGTRYDGDAPILSEIKAEMNKAASVDNMWSKTGAYKYLVTPVKADDPNFVTGTGHEGTMWAHKVEDLVDFYYGDTETKLGTDYDIIKTDSKVSFDDHKIVAVDDDDNEYTRGNKKLVIANVIDSGGNNVDGTSWWTVAGDYTAIYKVLSSDGKVGNQAIVTVHVYEDAIDADATAAVLYDYDHDGDKEVVSSISKTYNGKDLMKEVEVAVEDKDGKAVPHTVTWTDADGNRVHEAINAGTYTLKVTAPGYKLSGTTEMTITVGKLDLGTIDYTKTALVFDETDNHNYYVPWDEDGVTIDDLGLKYDTGVKDSDNNDKADDGEGWDSLPMTAFKVTITDESGKAVKKMEDEGVYTVSFEARNADAENNYVTPEAITVTVIKDGTHGADVDHTLFSDVTYRDYFADAVAYVSDDARGWMNGYKNRAVFGSLDSLSRGQVASVLYNMAGGDSLKVEGSYSDLWGYETGFSDVDGFAYYARAIAWAKQAGVVNGYADGTFHADQAVTRQEFACMLANYAKKYGTYKAASSDALDKMSDADQVAEFATESVAWAVENGIIGNSGYVAAGSTIIRADAACMVYNYAK